MSIDSITGTTQTQTQTQSTGGALKGSQDEFLKLFMAQLQYQDPFAPTSNAEMVGQLAQLSSVEQAKQTNAQLADLAAAQNAVANAGLSTLVGRDCSASVGSFQMDGKGGAPPPMNLTTPSATVGASIVITDGNGKEIRKIPIPDGTTSTQVAWDGKDASGQPVSEGSYSMTIDKGKSPSSISASWSGRVDAVELTADGPRLRMGGVLLLPGDIHTIGSTAVAPATSNNTTTSSSVSSAITGQKVS